VAPAERLVVEDADIDARGRSRRRGDESGREDDRREEDEPQMEDGVPLTNC
jgi:hypothetical protein